MCWVIVTQYAIIEPQVCVLSEAKRAFLFDVTDRIVCQPSRAFGKAERIVESVAREENLADPLLIVEEASSCLRIDPFVEPLLRVFASRTDTVLLGD